MDTKGSITVFFTLVLSLVITLISTLLLSAKVAAGRTQIALAVDQAMFSAFAKYDRTLFEEYHLLYMDGGYGIGTLQLGKALDEMETDISYLLTPDKNTMGFGGENLLQLTYLSGAITGYTLATDCNGSVFKEQVISYMKDTVGIQGSSLLIEKLTEQIGIMESQDNVLKSIEQQGTLDDYENIKAESAQLQKKEEEEIHTSEETDTAGLPVSESISEETKKIAEQAKTTLDTVSAKKNIGILQMVLPESQQISGWAAQEKELLSNRKLQTGMGFLQADQEETIVENVLFQKYLLQNINYYQNEKRSVGPAYGLEWIIFGKVSDRENLEAMAERLLLIREAANTASLCMDSAKMEEVHLLADSLSILLKMPFVKPILEGAIILAWAYAESIVDLSALFDGATVPLIKDSSSWQVSFGEIPGALLSPGNYYKENEGADYETYLQAFLMLCSEDDQVQGAIEVIESSIREIPGKEYFFFDCAIDTMEVCFQVRSEDYITFDITRNRSYRTE